MSDVENKLRVIDPLLAFIGKMPEEKQLALLRELEEREAVNKRQHRRKAIDSPVYFATNDKAFKSVLRDVSSSGVFIETSESLFMGQEVMMTFHHPDKPKLIKKKGVVVRKSEDGIGIKFTS
jgi:hypothetical protein